MEGDAKVNQDGHSNKFLFGNNQAYANWRVRFRTAHRLNQQVTAIPITWDETKLLLSGRSFIIVGTTLLVVAVTALAALFIRGDSDKTEFSQAPVTEPPAVAETIGPVTRPVEVERQTGTGGLMPQFRLGAVPPKEMQEKIMVALLTHQSDASARAAYLRMQALLPNTLKDRQPYIRRIDQGAYRVEIGPFETTQKAFEFCKVLSRPRRASETWGCVIVNERIP
jgi:hypothetical protein